MTDAAKKTGVFGFLKNIVAEEVPDRPAAGKRNTPVPAASAAPHDEPHNLSADFGSRGATYAPDAASLGKLEARLQIGRLARAAGTSLAVLTSHVVAEMIE